MLAILRIIFLFGLFSFFFTVSGYLLGGEPLMFFSFFLSWVLNIGIYFFADKLVLSLSGAKTLDKMVSNEVYIITKELCTKMGLPIPRVFISPEMQANAFSTGRGTGNATIVITRGIINSLSQQEMMAVLAQQLGYIKSLDVMSVTIGVALSSAFLFLANMSFYAGPSDDQNLRNKGLVGKLITVLIFLASIITKITVSPRRQYSADKKSARVFSTGEFLSSALLKLNTSAINTPIFTNPALSSLYIVDPFGETGGKILQLFTTHPLIEERIKRLEKI